MRETSREEAEGRGQKQRKVSISGAWTWGEDHETSLGGVGLGVYKG
jgi:hypothetical protein